MTAFTSTGTGGNWSNSASWTPGGGPPGDGDTITVVSGDLITIDQNVVIGTGSGTAIQLNEGGEIDVNSGASRTFDVKGLFQMDGKFTIDYSGVTNTFDIGIDQDSQSSGTHVLDTKADSTSGGVILSIKGNPTYKRVGNAWVTEVGSAISASDGTFTIDAADIGDYADSVGGYDFVVEGDTAANHELVAVTDYNDTTGVVTISGTFANAHAVGRKVWHVTRNVTFGDVSADTNKKTWLRTQRIGVADDANRTVLNDIRFERMGETNLDAQKHGLSFQAAGNNRIGIQMLRCCAILQGKGFGMNMRSLGHAFQPCLVDIQDLLIFEAEAGSALTFGVSPVPMANPMRNIWLIGTGTAGQIGYNARTEGDMIVIKGGGIIGMDEAIQTGTNVSQCALWFEDILFDNNTEADVDVNAGSTNTCSMAKVHLIRPTTRAAADVNVVGSEKIARGVPGAPESNVGYVKIHEQNDDPDESKTYYADGVVSKETSVVQTSTASVLIEPNDTSNPQINYPLRFPEFYVPVRNVQVTIKVWLRKNQSQTLFRPLMELYLPGNEWGDVADDSAIMTDVDDTWEQVTLQATPTRSGVCRVVCNTHQESSGYRAYLDNFEVTQP